jgi:hypothetical protein
MSFSFEKPYIRYFSFFNKKTLINASLCLWVVPEDIDVDYFKSTLSKTEQDILSTIKGYNKVRNFILGRYLSKIAISDFLSKDDFDMISVSKGIFNNPLVDPPYSNVRVSLAHTSKLFISLASGSEGLLGVDAERINKNRALNINTVLNFPKNTDIDIDETTEAFIKWTSMESIGKALGVGIGLPFSFYKPKSHTYIGDGIESTFFYMHQFKCHSFKFIDHIITLAYPSNLTLKELELHNCLGSQ